MLTTEEWARSHGISAAPTPPPIEGYDESCARTAREVAIRTIILQGVVAVASEVDPEPIIEWFHDQRIWRSVTPEEEAFLQNPSPIKEVCNRFGWHQEAEWTLLWAIGKVESLGLPTRGCDTRRLCDEIIPPLGSDVADFLTSSELRPPGVLLAEDDRTYDLWCCANGLLRKGEKLPDDLNWSVLYERRYAFEWLDGMQDWDDVTCDS